MTIQERLLNAREQSVKLYLERQEVELVRQQVQVRAAQIDHQLMKLDGIIDALEAQLREPQPAAPQPAAESSDGQ